MKIIIQYKIHLIFFLFLSVLSNAQDSSIKGDIESTILVSTGNNLPFWMTHNELGKYSSTGGSWQELSEGKVEGSVIFTNKLNINYGIDLALLINQEEIKPEIIQAYTGLSGKIFCLKIGTFADEEILGGLSTSNGNIVRSLNYRPYPMIRISTSGFIPLLFWGKWFRFKIEYDEGKLYDERIIIDPHLHHKSIAFKYIHSKIYQFTIGIDHYVFWGGHSERYGKFPDDFNSYILYISGSEGGDTFLETDQNNVAGNQLGAYHIIANIDIDNSYFDFRISHPFEDHSGMELANFKDNLYSLYWKKKKKDSFINEMLVEYLLTKSGDPLKNRRACDNYHNHGIYQTGFSYLEHGMGTPMFYPLKKNEEGTIVGFENNRISAFHFGAKGYFSKQINWEALFTYSRNFGTYHVPYDTALEQINFVGEITWNFKNYPLSISAQIANDTGDLVENRTGFGLSLNRTF